MNRTQEKVGSVEDEVLTFIADYIDEHHWAPSYREICDGTTPKSTSTVRGYILRLEAKGYLIFGNGPRKIAMTEKGWEKAEKRVK